MNRAGNVKVTMGRTEPADATACASESEQACVSRRSFLLSSAGTVVALSVVPWSNILMPANAHAKIVSYGRKKVGALSALTADTPVSFLYPDDDPVYAQCILVKLGREAGAGVGPDRDIVAYSSLCPHMGGPVGSVYNAEHKIAGPCPTHLTTFDLTRHGIVVSGHATESLPQITLETQGDDIFATGVLGLVFGRSDNLPGRAER